MNSRAPHQPRRPVSNGITRLRRVSGNLAISAAVLSGLGIVALVAMTLVNIFLRNTSNGAVPNAVGWGEVGVAAIAYLGLAYTQNQNAHVSTVVVVRLLPRRAQRYIKLFWMAVICLLLAWVGVETASMAIDSFDRFESRYGNVPIWPARIAVSVGIWLLFVELVVQLIDLAFGSRDLDSDADPDEEISISDGV